jgi:glycosyltransferase involved in cell wall biosynthesis
MKISIVTPSYNQAEFLPQTFASVLGQRDPDLEYVVVHAGSTDGSLEIAMRARLAEIAERKPIPLHSSSPKRKI